MGWLRLLRKIRGFLAIAAGKFLVPLARKSRLMTEVYFLVTGGFGWEQYSVLAGQQAWRRGSSLNPHAIAYGLRRSIHRIEKGLTYRDVRTTFAVSYIEQTVNWLGQIHEAYSEAESKPSVIHWAHGVLDVYFEVTAESDAPAIRRARGEYERLGSFHTCRSLPRVSPFVRPSTECPVSLEQLRELVSHRRSVRDYLLKPVPRRVIDRAIEVAIEAPSACNRQPFVFKVFDEPGTIERLMQIPRGFSGYEFVPCVIAVVGEFCAFPELRDRHVPYIDASLATMGLQLALETQGVSSCCINWPDIAEQEVAIREEVDLRDDQRIIILLAVGYAQPDCTIPGSLKKDLDEIRQFC